MTPSGAAMLLMVTDQGDLLLHLRDDKAGIAYPDHWAGFGGALEEGESPLQAVKREVLEETGLEIDNPIFLTETFDTEGSGNLMTIYYLVGAISPDDIVLTEGAGVGIHSLDSLDRIKVPPFLRRAIDQHLKPRISGSC